LSRRDCPSLYTDPSRAPLGSRRSLAGQLEYPAGHDGLGIVFVAGLGDGVYPVFAEYEDAGPFGRRIARVTVELLPRPGARVERERSSRTGGS